MLASIIGRAAAPGMSTIQSLVLTSDALFDGWSHLSAPMSGGTIRKAITVGTKVDDWKTLEVVGNRAHLRIEDPMADTILRGLSDLELKIAPEHGVDGKVSIGVASAIFLVPDLIAGSAPTEHDARERG